MADIEQLKYRYHGSIVGLDGRLNYYNGDGKQKYLLPCARITDPDLLVGVIDYNQLPIKRLRPAHKDRLPIRLVIEQTGEILEVTHHGISAFLYFHGLPNREVMGVLVESGLKRLRKRTDHLHLSIVRWIEEAGWQAWWTPLPERDNWLHLRLIPNCIAEEGRNASDVEANSLKEAFVKAL
jgi:hypothetical protein